MPRYLVTGGCGFIGSHLVDVLIARGHAVRVLDDLSSGKRDGIGAGVELMVGDVADGETVQRALQDMDGCFHLAAVASVERCTRDWLRSHRTNLGGTVAVFEAAARRRLPVIYASTAAVYGEPAEIPISERTPT